MNAGNQADDENNQLQDPILENIPASLQQSALVNETLIQDIASVCLEQGECPICLDNMFLQETVKTPCKHVFHLECLELQLIRNPSCPLCRGVLSSKRNQIAGQVTMRVGITENLVEDAF